MARPLKHLPVDQWPKADREAFVAAFAEGDVLDDTTGAGAHLSNGTRRFIRTGYRRWLGFLTVAHPKDLVLPPAERISQGRIRGFVESLGSDIRSTTVATGIDALYYAARLIAPASDWGWLKALKARLAARAKPEDRFHRLVPPWQILDLGIELMDTAAEQPRRGESLQFRDGLILAVLSVWPIRRRSIAALTIDRHLEFDDAGAALLLFPEDTKSHRAERLRLPQVLVPYLRRYVREMRQRLVPSSEVGLWGSAKGGRLTDSRIYDIARARIRTRFGKLMGLHDFRRAAATFTAIAAPEMVGIIPGVLQHTAPGVSEKHYNLARSTEASRRLGASLESFRAAFRSPSASHPSRAKLLAQDHSLRAGRASPLEADQFNIHPRPPKPGGVR